MQSQIRTIFDKIMVIICTDMFIVGYWTSHTSFIRSTVDVFFLIVGILFVDFMILIMWERLKNG